jgi:hypothetical protein
MTQPPCTTDPTDPPLERFVLDCAGAEPALPCRYQACLARPAVEALRRLAQPYPEQLAARRDWRPAGVRPGSLVPARCCAGGACECASLWACAWRLPPRALGPRPKAPTFSE